MTSFLTIDHLMRFFVLLATIASIQFAGYMSIRLFGQRFGIPLMGLLGGFVSSTAVFANLPHTLKSYPKSQAAILASVLLSTAAMLIEILVILFVASEDLFLLLDKMIFAMLFFLFASSVFLIRLQKKELQTEIPFSKSVHFPSIFSTSLFIALTLIVIALAKRYVGAKAVLAASFLVGLFEIHGISLSTALLYMEKSISLEMARQILFTAIVATFFSKLFLLWSLTSKNFAWKASGFLILTLFIGSILITYR